MHGPHVQHVLSRCLVVLEPAAHAELFFFSFFLFATLQLHEADKKKTTNSDRASDATCRTSATMTGCDVRLSTIPPLSLSLSFSLP